MSANLAADYRRIRTAYPSVSATIAVHWARHTPKRTLPGIEWDTDNHGTVTAAGMWTDPATGRRYSVSGTFEFEPDSHDFIDGTFTNRWEADAVRNPNWREGSDVCEWYVSSTGYTVASQRADLSRSGMARHAAYTAAVSQARAEALAAAQPNYWSFTATVSYQGIPLGTASLGAIQMADGASVSDFADVGADVITEAIETAVQSVQVIRT